jgi:hypothetical protein
MLCNSYWSYEYDLIHAGAMNLKVLTIVEVCLGRIVMAISFCF